MGRSEPDAYRRVARWYDSIFGRLNAGLRGLGLKMLPPREGMDVLDVGCGTGIQLASYQRVSSSACTVSATSSACGVRVSSSSLPTAASTTPPGMVWQRVAPSWMQRFMHW